MKVTGQNICSARTPVQIVPIHYQSSTLTFIRLAVKLLIDQPQITQGLFQLPGHQSGGILEWGFRIFT
jgi:hypothetical protein